MEMETFPGSSVMIKGRIPAGIWLLLGTPGSGKTTFCRQFTWYGLRNHQPCIYVITEESPEDFREGMKSFGFDVTSQEREDLIRLVDCYAWRSSGVSSSRYALSNPGSISEILILVEEARKGIVGPSRFVLDSITSLTVDSGQETVLKFLRILKARLRNHGQIGFCTVEAGAHDEYFMNHLRYMFDGIVELKLEERDGELRRFIRVYSMKRAKHELKWFPFKITNDGIVVENRSANLF